MSGAATGRLETLDGLRGLAALVVVVSHCANAGYLPRALGAGFGQMGVGIFYVLSGFLMSHLYLHGQPDAAAMRRYLVARLTRVLPLFHLVLALSLLGFAVSGVSVYGVATWPGILRNAFLLHGSTILWSVPVEVQYYLLFLLIWRAWQGGWHGRALAGLVVGQAALAVAIFVTLRETALLPFWLHYFLFGHLLSLAVARGVLAGVASHPAARRLAWGAVVLLPLAPPMVRGLLGVPVLPIFADPVSAGYPALIMALALTGAGPFRALAWPGLRWLGRISFGIYLLHWPVLALAPLLPDPVEALPGAVFVLVLLVTAGLAEIAWRLVEHPAQGLLRPWLDEALAPRQGRAAQRTAGAR
ncbi:acyltransferase family protein [Aquicoccus sp. SCR17]|nr:acyltransferase family protein [Carideicomes alvinocaridis]